MKHSLLNVENEKKKNSYENLSKEIVKPKK